MTSQSDSQLERSQYTLTLVTDWVKYADTKATLLLTIGVTILGVSLTDIPLATKVVRFCFANNHNPGGYFLILAHVIFYAVLIFAIYLLLTVVRPKLVAKSEKHSWYFFQSMALLAPEDFHSYTQQLTNGLAAQQINDQIYNNSVVARQKFETIKHAYNSLVIAVITGLAAIIPVLIISDFLPSK